MMPILGNTVNLLDMMGLSIAKWCLTVLFERAIARIFTSLARFGLAIIWYFFPPRQRECCNLTHNENRYYDNRRQWRARPRALWR